MAADPNLLQRVALYPRTAINFPSIFVTACTTFDATVVLRPRDLIWKGGHHTNVELPRKPCCRRFLGLGKPSGQSQNRHAVFYCDRRRISSGPAAQDLVLIVAPSTCGSAMTQRPTSCLNNHARSGSTPHDITRKRRTISCSSMGLRE